MNCRQLRCRLNALMMNRRKAQAREFSNHVLRALKKVKLLAMAERILEFPCIDTPSGIKPVVTPMQLQMWRPKPYLRGVNTLHSGQ